MSLLIDFSSAVSEAGVQPEQETRTVKDEFTICMETINHQNSSVSEALKEKKKAETSNLQEIFEETVRDRGEYPFSKFEWTNDKEVVVDGLSPMILHNFVLKAEKLGKKVSYIRTLKVKITD
ncbi:MAG: hypothetical protein GDA51_02590 [Ekhidna sp.]|nr:hypothetical protein [Ekhidna sp.]MBC6410782.1 hypothetical protein [Ekhidna sp.]MBC6425363.1 hypothetical protein [Ekhidna sp.]